MAMLFVSERICKGSARNKRGTEKTVLSILVFAPMQVLTITCEHPTFLSVKRFQRIMTTFLNLLLRRHAPCRLHEFYLPSLAIERYWRYEVVRQKFFVSLTRYRQWPYREPERAHPCPKSSESHLKDNRSKRSLPEQIFQDPSHDIMHLCLCAMCVECVRACARVLVCVCLC